jgi:hypothetical protein
MADNTDILENDILNLSPQLLKILLKDHSASHHFKQDRNIIWATHDYETLGAGYLCTDQILPELITGNNGKIIQPRAQKSLEIQQQRITDKAEVFTPAWICNKQNNLVDNAWFNRENVFNTEIDNGNSHSWKVTEEKIPFPKDKTWQDYVLALRMEISCGEAPYITSRYDAVICDGVIPVKKRIGILDRKLRIINENTLTQQEWYVWAFNALHSTYGFEYQGDNLLLAREAVLYTFLEHYEDKFSEKPSVKTLENASYIISWNFWQMDGIKCVVPLSCEWATKPSGNLFGDFSITECPACKKGEQKGHTGIKCEVVEWKKVTMQEPSRIGSKKNIFIYPNLTKPSKSKEPIN